MLLPLAVLWFSGLVLAALDGRRRWAGWLAIAGLAAGFLTTLQLAVSVMQEGPQELVAGGWPIEVGITLRADALGVAFAVLSLGMLLVALACEVLGGVHERQLPALVLFMATGLTGLFLTADIFNFYVFFEMAMISSFVLASYGKRIREIRAAMIFTTVNLLGSVLFLSGIAALYHMTGTLDMRETARWVATVEQNSVIPIATIIFVAFSIKLGLFPFHFWLPPVYRDAWPAVAAMLSGALANIGSYGLLRFGAGMLSRELQFSADALVVLGSVSILYGAVQAISVRTTSEALAYSAIGQAGYILAALGIGGPIGYAAVVLYAIVNSLNKTLLFLAAGLRGRLVGAAFAIGAFSVAGVPPALGFFGKVALFQAGLAADNMLLTALIFVGGALSFIYMFQIYQGAYWEERGEGAISPLSVRMIVIGLAGLIIALGVWPEPLLAVSQQAAMILPIRTLP